MTRVCGGTGEKEERWDLKSESLRAVGEDLLNWSPRQPERIEDLKRARERRPGRFAPWERDIAFLIGFYEAALGEIYEKEDS